MNKFIYFIIAYFLSIFVAAEELGKDIYINSKNIYYDKEKNIIILGKNSFIDYKSASIKTDNATIDNNTKEILIPGNFYLNFTTDILRGNYLKGDLNFNNAYAEGVNYIYNKNLKIDSELLLKKNQKIIFSNSFITPCDLNGIFNCPTWSLKVKKSFYNVDKDKFDHFGTFVQIADKKIAYLPFFSHYGSKAERAMGFLTPTVQPININLGSNTTVPYYVPIKNHTELTFKPTFYFQRYLKDYFTSTTILKSKISEGNISLTVDNTYDNRNKNITSKSATFKSKADLILNRNNRLTLDASYVSDVSEYKNSNDTKAATLNSNVQLKTYNFLTEQDLLISKFSATKSLASNAINTSNPYEIPSLKYLNFININKKISLKNQINIDHISRHVGLDFLPNKIYRINIKNDFRRNYKLNSKYNLKNKIIFYTNGKLTETSNKTTNSLAGSSINFNQYYSSEYNKKIKYNDKMKFKPRFKVILSGKNSNKDLNVNDNSQSLAFNYNNLYKENRYFGTDVNEESQRLAFGIEHEIENFYLDTIELNLGKSYDFRKNTRYLKDINQNQNFSDYLSTLAIKINKNTTMNYELRLDHDNLEIKEDSINFNYNSDKSNFSLSKIKTDKRSFKNSTKDHFLMTNYTYKFNENSNLSYNSEINILDKFKPYKQTLGIDFHDDCSKLSLIYDVEDYNDGAKVKPNKKLTIKYQMDYLGVFGYDTKGNYIFQPNEY